MVEHSPQVLASEEKAMMMMMMIMMVMIKGSSDIRLLKIRERHSDLND